MGMTMVIARMDAEKNARNRYRFPEKFAGEIRAFEKTRLGVPFVVLVN